MPHSLRAKLSGLRYKGMLEDKDYKRLCHALDLEKAEQEQKSGHWIHFAQSDDCSECGWSTGKYISPSKFCPNCGCRMVEPQEQERSK